MKLLRRMRVRKPKSCRCLARSERVSLLLHGSNGVEPCCGNIRDRFCGE